MTNSTRFVALDSDGHRIGTYDDRDAAVGACQAAAAEAGDDGEGYEVVETGSIRIVIAGPELGDIFSDKYESECARLESCYTECEADTQYFTTVRPCHSGEAPGTYQLCANGNLQIFGYSIEMPNDLHDLSEEAFNKFCR